MIHKLRQIIRTKRFPKVCGLLLLVSFYVIILALTLRGNSGVPDSVELSESSWTAGGPFELSPERGRFALLYSIVEDQSLSFSIPLARFAAPDVGYFGGKYVSLFAPGVSFIVIPGYLIGKLFAASQLGAFAAVAVFAVANGLLIKKIAESFGVEAKAGTIAGLIFVFATPAFAYSVTLYQHQVSTFIILCSVYLLNRYSNFWYLSLVWFLVAVSFVVDYPNLVMMIPLVLVALSRLVVLDRDSELIKFKILSYRLLTVLAIFIPLLLLLWFNQISYGHPLRLSGSVTSAEVIDDEGKPSNSRYQIDGQVNNPQASLKKKQSITQFFSTREMLNGFYIHFLSPDRGMLTYTPVILLGFVGLVYASFKKMRFVSLLAAVVGLNILLYSMWGDPYGGWAFGSRYLIPAYALLAIYLAYLLQYWKRNLLFMVLFFILAAYSVAVNTLGAVTSNSNPPQVEAIALERVSGKKEYYTYRRNIDYLNDNYLKSAVFQKFAQKHISAWQYYGVLTGTIIAVFGSLTILLYRQRKENRYEK